MATTNSADRALKEKVERINTLAVQLKKEIASGGTQIRGAQKEKLYTQNYGNKMLDAANQIIAACAAFTGSKLYTSSTF